MTRKEMRITAEERIDLYFLEVLKSIANKNYTAFCILVNLFHEDFVMCYLLEIITEDECDYLLECCHVLENMWEEKEENYEKTGIYIS